MEITTAGEMIANMGFPIVMCLILFYYINSTQKSLTDAITELRETLSELKGQIENIRRGDKND